MSKEMKRTIVGQVHYLTITITFPKDKDQWVRQIPIPGSTAQAVFLYVSALNIAPEMKAKLCKDLECSWKDDQGAWTQLVIERTKRNSHNGHLAQVLKPIR